MQSKLTGYTFRQSTAKPFGEVSLVWEKDNEYDPKAIACYFNDEHIGYLPAKGAEKEYVYNELQNNRIVRATIVEYKFGYEKDGKMVFNDNHEGILAHVVIEIEGHLGYEKNGKQYKSITKLLKYLNPDEEQTNLHRWMMQFSSYEEYEKAFEELSKKGTELHKTIEIYYTGASGDVMFMPIKEFDFKHKPSNFKIEQTVFNDELLIAGTYDMLAEINGKKVLIDWKSSKKPNKKHELQASFYAHNLDADEAWIVCFGGDNKQGYSVRKITRPFIEINYQIVKHLNIIVSLLEQ